MFLKRRKAEPPANAIISQISLTRAGFSSEIMRPEFRTLIAEQRLDMGVAAAAAGLGSVLEVLQRARHWAAVRIEGKLLKKIEAVSPSVLFDVEKKLVFTSALTKEAVAYYSFLSEAREALNQAAIAGDEDAQAEIRVLIVSGMLAFLSAIQAVYIEYESFFGRGIYDRNAEKLTSLTVDDRRAIEGFYSRFDLAVARMARLFEREIPAALSRDTVALSDVIGWVNGLSECIVALIESAQLVIDG